MIPSPSFESEPAVPPRRTESRIPLHWFSPEEEFAHAATHGAGLVLSAVAVVILLARCHQTDASPAQLVGSLIYGISLLLLYAASTFYHMARSPHWRRVLRVADHSCIYLLIAGSYTPFMLTFLWGPWGWSILSAVWALAIAGVVFKLLCTGRFEGLSIALSLTMGWLCVLAIRPMLEVVPPGCLGWLLAGGVFYTVGVIFYRWDSRRWNHAIWHCCVLAGSISQFVAVAVYTLPH